jgi:tetratricopeptide (TPR) repeat protein
MMKSLWTSALILLVLAGASWADDPCASPDITSKANLAQSLNSQKKYVDAEASATAVLKSCPTHPVAVRALGASLVAQKRYDDAVARLTPIITDKPSTAYAYLWRGYAFYYKGQSDRMVSDFQTFLNLQPNAPEAKAIRQLIGGLQN